MIGVGQGWDQIEALGSPVEIQASIHQRFAVETAVTAAYDNRSRPDESDLYFVIHVLGQLMRSLLEELVGFGMDACPNIGYGLSSEPDRWPEQVFEWNEVFVRWFRLKVGNAALSDSILSHVELLFWTGDGHLTFAVEKKSDHEEILEIIAQVAAQHKLDLILGEVKGY
jgi:hypothetical protein